MKTFDFIPATIFHYLKDPHSKSLEPDCLSPFVVIMTQALVGGDEGEEEISIFTLTLSLSPRGRGSIF